MSHLTLPDLVQALERHTERHHAFDVFADDVRELRALRDTGALPAGWLALDEGGRRFVVQHEGHAYEVELFPRSGVVRLQRAPETAPQEGVLATGALARDIAGAAIDEANERKGDWWMPELVLGLLVGDRVGAAETPEGVRALPRRVFPLHYDLTDKGWVYLSRRLLGGNAPDENLNLLLSVGLHGNSSMQRVCRQRFRHFAVHAPPAEHLCSAQTLGQPGVGGVRSDASNAARSSG